MSEQGNRRTTRRVTLNRRVQAMSAKGHSMLRAVDISEGGMRLRSPRELPEGPIKVYVPVPKPMASGDQLYILDAKVVWRGRFATGLVFVDPPIEYRWAMQEWTAANNARS